MASGINGPLTAAHVAALLPWVDGLEVRNGSRLASQNRTAECLAAAAGKVVARRQRLAHRARHRLHLDRSARARRRRPSSSPGCAPAAAVVGGRHGDRWTMSSDIVRFAANLCVEQARDACARPVVAWAAAGRRSAASSGCRWWRVALAGGLLHFVHEQRFNRDLLFDLVARPADTLRRVPELAA